MQIIIRGIHTHFRILEEIGAGQFGEVCKAQWAISGATKDIAVKTLRAELPEQEKVRFLQEAAIMGQFSHLNVIKLYGVVTVGDPVSHEIYTWKSFSVLPPS